MRNRALINLLQPSYSPFAFDQFFDEDERGAFLTNFQENEEAYFTYVDMPGVTSDDINIDVEDSYVRISAERKDTFDKDNVVMKKYEYTVGLPTNVDKDKISAHYENGVLSLALQKTVEDSKSKKKIAVSTGEKPKSWMNFMNIKKLDSGKKEASSKLN